MSRSDINGCARAAAAPSQLESGLFTPRGLVELLYLKAAPQLSLVDLSAIAIGAASYAEGMARRSADMADGLGCLIAHDASNGPGAGNFQDGEAVSQLLFHFGDLLRSIEGVAWAGAWAAAELEERGRK